MNNIKEDKKVLKNIKSNRFTSEISAIMDESNIYQTSESIYSSNSSIQTIPNDEMQEILGDNEEMMEVDQEDTQDNMEQETEVAHLPGPNTTIYVPDLPNCTTEEDLLTSFRGFGPIENIEIHVLPDSNSNNASIKFTHYDNAKSAMSCMNGTTYKNKSCKIFMSKRRSFPKPKDFYNKSPLGELEKMIKNMPAQSTEHTTIIQPETEHHTQGDIADDMTTSKKNQKRKFNTHINLDQNSTKTAKTNSDLVLTINQTKQSGKMLSEVEVQEDVSCQQPDTHDIAHQLFQHWEQHLNFHEDIHKTKNGAFVINTINELANMAGKATPYQQEDI